MVDSRLEKMENIEYDTGYQAATPGADTVQGRLLMPQGGRGSGWWNHGLMPHSPWHGWMPGDPAPDLDPGFTPPNLPGPPRERPAPAPGDGRKGGEMMGAGYDNPAAGLGDASAAFIGIGRMTAACDIPNDVQPGVPGGGLFGPDAQIPWGSRPGYKPTPSLMNSNMPRPWVDFSPFQDLGIPGNIGPARPPSIGSLTGWEGNPSPTIGETFGKLANLKAQQSAIARSFMGTGGGRVTGTQVAIMMFARLDAESMATTGTHATYRYLEIHGASLEELEAAYGRAVMYNGELVRVFDNPGSELHVGDKVYNNPTGQSHAVESYVSGRTGLSSYSEDTREIPRGTDLGKYFEEQKKGADVEATGWLVFLIAGTVLTIVAAATGVIGIGLRGAVSFFGGDAEAWYNSSLGFRKLGKGGWTYGRMIKKWPWRVDYHRLPNDEKILKWARGKRLPHYHRRVEDPVTGETLEGLGSGRHRPYERPMPGKPWWWWFL